MPWRTDPTIAKLTRDLLALHARSSTRRAEDCVALGNQLAKVRERIPYGDWVDWLASAVPFTRQSAGKYMRLAQFARNDPADYRRLRHLGPAKLYVLMAHPSPRRRALPLSRSVQLPDGRRKTVVQMTSEDLEDLLDDLALPPAPQQPIDKIVRTFRFKLGALVVAAAEVVERKGDIDEDDARKWHGELAKVLTKLADAFGL
jgi:hypothetical protein